MTWQRRRKINPGCVHDTTRREEPLRHDFPQLRCADVHMTSGGQLGDGSRAQGTAAPV
jgi:hypothetical protein